MTIPLTRAVSIPAESGERVQPTYALAPAKKASRLALHAVATVLLFWWLATGAIFVLERSESTRLLGIVLATLLAVVGVAMLRMAREDDSARGVRRAFLGGALLWTWVQVAFYGGWLIGPAALRHAIPAESPSLPLATRAIAAMLWYQLAMLGVLGVAGAIAWRHRNRTGVVAIGIFWIEHQLASINIFLGVENPGRGFFPDVLLFLESYFGPPRNTLLLPASAAALLVIAAVAAIRFRRGETVARRQAMLLVGVLAMLGVMELAVLGGVVRSDLFAWAMQIRGF